MKYMLLIYGNEDLWQSFSQEQFAELVRETDALNAALLASGELVGAYGVADQSEAKQLRVTGGERIVTDGPYIETKEYLGSFTIVDVDSEERAHAIAARNPASRYTAIEIRPLLHEAPMEL